jgi:hypothetical protein
VGKGQPKRALTVFENKSSKSLTLPGIKRCRSSINKVSAKKKVRMNLDLMFGYLIFIISAGSVNRR